MRLKRAHEPLEPSCRIVLEYSTLSTCSLTTLDVNGLKKAFLKDRMRIVVKYLGLDRCRARFL